MESGPKYPALQLLHSLQLMYSLTLSGGAEFDRPGYKAKHICVPVRAFFFLSSPSSLLSHQECHRVVTRLLVTANPVVGFMFLG